MRVMQSFIRKQYNHNPKGSATVEVTMAQHLPFERPVSIVQAGNVPILNPSRKLWGPNMPGLSHTRAIRGPRTSMVAANVDGLGDDVPALPAMTPLQSLQATALKVGDTLAQGAAAKLASKIAPKGPRQSVMPQFIQNVPRTNWMIVGVAAVAAVGGIFMLTRRGGGARRRR